MSICSGDLKDRNLGMAEGMRDLLAQERGGAVKGEMNSGREVRILSQ